MRNVATCAQHAIPYLKPDISLLDVGSGPGTITVDIAKHYVTAGRVVGFDKNPASVEATELLGSSNNTEWATGDAADLGQFADASFDVVYSHQLLMYTPDPVAGLREMRRVCRPGGIVTTRDLAGLIPQPESAHLRRFRVLQDAIMRAQGGLGLESGRANLGWARDAGFDVERVEVSCQGWSVAGEAMKNNYYSGVVDSVRAPAVALGLATDEEMDGLAVAWKEWIADPGQCDLSQDLNGAQSWIRDSAVRSMIRVSLWL